jgi:hypothetical protein
MIRDAILPKNDIFDAGQLPGDETTPTSGLGREILFETGAIAVSVYRTRRELRPCGNAKTAGAMVRTRLPWPMSEKLSQL